MDTSAWLALYDRHDQSHRSAARVAGHLKAERATLVLSDHILTETLTLIRYRVSHPSAVRFGRAILQSRVAELVGIDQEARQRAWEIFQRYDDQDFSFTDCTSFAVMERMGVRVAFAFDRRFRQYGFQLLA